jgi:hypothetical protein
LISSVTVFSPFLPFFLWARQPSAICPSCLGLLFVGEAKNFAFQFVYWGTTNPRGVTVATNWMCLGGQLAGVNDGDSMALKTIVGASST